MATAKTTRFELRGADGRPLRGDVRTVDDGGGRPAVVICHGFKGFKDWGFFPQLAARLARAGLTAVTFNFSGSGVGSDGESFSEPDRFGNQTFTADVTDIGTVHEALQSGSLVQGLASPAKVALFGHSRGGGSAVLYAARNRHISALVTWAAIASIHRWDKETVEKWRRDGKIDVVNARTGDILPLYLPALDEAEREHDGKLDLCKAAARMSAPWLVIHGAMDETVPVAEGEMLYESARGGPVELDLMVVPSAGHTFGARHPWAGATQELDRVMGATVKWFTGHLV